MVFGIYLGVLGLTLAIAPNIVTRMVGVPETSEPWLRVVGALAVNIGLYYVAAARNELRPIMWASVPARFAIPVWLAAFVVFADAEPSVLVFGLADLAGATWTVLALRADRAIRTLP
jgi:hypothetical protein